jgi:hypothetical protein
MIALVRRLSAGACNLAYCQYSGTDNRLGSATVRF